MLNFVVSVVINLNKICVSPSLHGHIICGSSCTHECEICTKNYEKIFPEIKQILESIDASMKALVKLAYREIPKERLCNHLQLEDFTNAMTYTSASTATTGIQYSKQMRCTTCNTILVVPIR